MLPYVYAVKNIAAFINICVKGVTINSSEAKCIICMEPYFGVYAMLLFFHNLYIKTLCLRNLPGNGMHH